MVSRRSVLLGGLAAMAGLAVPSRARATVALALSLNELVHQSRHAFVGTPVDSFGRWETVGRKSRIVTYTLVQADHAFDGRPAPTSEVMIRTLGGVVSDIGQVVPGEALLQKGVPSAVFIQDISRDLFAVTGMSQGHYPLVLDQHGVRRLRAATGLVELWGAGESAAVRRLDDRTVTEVETLVYQELARGAQ